MKEEKEVKKSNTGLAVFITILVMLVLGLSAFIVYDKALKPDVNVPQQNDDKDNKTEEKDNEKKEETTIELSRDELNLMQSTAEMIFKEEKESLNISMLTNYEKLMMVFDFNKTGKEMQEDFQKRFGKNNSITFEDIKCLKDSNAIEYNYDSSADKYVNNPNHMGHGGGWINARIISNIYYDKVKKEGEKLYYYTRVLFMDNVRCFDTGPCNFNKAYGSYSDAKNGANALLDINNDTKYQVTRDGAVFSPEYDAIYDDFSNKLSSYVFEFEKENGNLVFNNYKKI